MKPSNIVAFLAASAIIAVTPSAAFAPMASSASRSSYHLSFSASSTMETDYAAVYHHAADANAADTEQQQQQHPQRQPSTAAITAVTDEDLFVASTTLPTFDRYAHAYTNLPSLGSGSILGEPSMMEELLRQERALADKLEQQLEQQQQMLEQQQEMLAPTTFFPIPTKESTKIMKQQQQQGTILFESDGLMMVEKSGHHY